MKIKRASIISFGNVFNKEYRDISPSLNVVYGKNESGKTTLMEFMRGTIFPLGGRTKTYPAIDKKNDRGNIIVTMDDSSEVLIKRGESKFEGIIDPPIYRNIFAMNPSDLRNSKEIDEGVIKNRFLTIPGGESLPKITTRIEKGSKDLLNLERMTDSYGIGMTKSHISKYESKISEFKTDDSEYDRLFDKSKVISRELNDLSAQEEGYSDIRSQIKLSESEEPVRAEIATLEGEIKVLSEADRITSDVLGRHKGLDEDLRIKENRLADSEDDLKKIHMDLNPDDLIIHKNDIEMIPRMIPDPTSERTVRKTAVETTSKGSNKPLGIGFLMIGALLLVAGVAFEPMLTIVGAGLMLVGAVALLFKRNAVETIVDTHVNNANMIALERHMSSLSNSLKFHGTNPVHDGNYLIKELEKAIKYKAEEGKVKNANLALMQSNTEMNMFYSEFGGKDGYDDLVSKKSVLDAKRIRLTALESTLKSPQPIGEGMVIPDASEVQDRISSLSRELGAINTEMKHILDNDERERAMDLLASYEAKLMEQSKEWAMLSLMSTMIDMTRKKLNSDVQPGVTKTANEYLALMTDGRYQLKNEPGSDVTSIVEDGIAKERGKWSTGLEDQVNLSIKMALAEVMSPESLPVMLDDCLLTFDSERKRNACKALSKMAERTQVFLFTCDEQTRDLMISEGNAKLITP